MTLKKSTVLLMLSIVLLSFNVNAQGKNNNATNDQYGFNKGTKSFGLAIGFGRQYDYYGDYYYSDYVPSPTFCLTYDQGIIDHVGPGNIGVGGVLAIKNTHYKYSDGSKAIWSNFIIGVRGTYHLTILRNKNAKFDPYGGVMLGVRIFKYKDTYYDDTYGSAYAVAGLFVGAKYNFSQHFGAFAELGYDVSLVRAGICLNL